MISTCLSSRRERGDRGRHPVHYQRGLFVGQNPHKVTKRPYSLKGQCHEIFCFWFFSWISFPQALEYTFRAVSNFFENSRRYSQLKVDHRCQRHRRQILPPVSVVLLIPVANLPPVSTIPAANCHQYQRHRRQTMRLISGWGYLKVNLKAKIYIYVNSISKGVPTKLLKFFWLKIFFICHRCQRHRWSTLSCEYLRDFWKKFEMVLMGYSGAGGGNWFIKKTRSKKSRDTVLLNYRRCLWKSSLLLPLQ